MNPEDDVILSLYADYRLWCGANGIQHEPWESFHNAVRHYNAGMIEYTRARYQENMQPKSQPMKPIQPNDEERAVAEVIRMLGGKR